MPQRNVATNFTFEQQRLEINLLASDFWTQKTNVDNAASTYLKHDGSNNFTGANLAVPNAFTINSNSGGGTVTIAGNLDVTGTTTTVSSANLEVTDKNILIAKGSTSDSQADGAGITIDSATDITWNFVDAKDAWVSNIGIESLTTLKVAGVASLHTAQFSGTTAPSAGHGVEIGAPDANTGQVIVYDRDNSAYKDLRLKGASVGMYAGTTNALIGGFHNTGLHLESGKTLGVGVVPSSGEGSELAVKGTDGATNVALIPNADTESSSIAFYNAAYDSQQGYIKYDNNNNSLSVRVNLQERLLVTSTGLVTNKGTWTNTYLTNDTTQCGIQVQNLSDTTDTYAALRLTTGTNSPATAQISSIRKGAGQNDLAIQLETGNTPFEALRISSNGDVYIGSPIPFDAFSSSRLYVEGYVCSARDDTSVAGGNGIGGMRFYSNDTNINSGNWLQVGGIDCQADGDFLASDAPTRLVFSTMQDGTTTLETRLTITSQGQLFHQANRADQYTAKFAQANASNPAWIEIDSPADSNVRPAYIQLQNASTDKWGIGQVYASTSAGAFHIGTGSHSEANSKFTITTDGKVGIGHINPVKKLDIRGTGNQGILVGSTDNNGAQIILDGNGDGDASGGNYGALEVLNNGDFTIRNHDASQSIIFGVGSASGANNTLVLDSSENATFAGDVADSKGSLRNLPRNEPSAVYTAVTADKGKFISNGNDVTFDNSATWNTGDVVTVYNYSASTIQIISGTGVLIHYTDGTTASTGTRTLAARGLCTLLCVEGSNNTFVISGALT